MAVIQGPEINRLVNLFNERDICIYHACQYKDFKAYLDLDGIPSRNLIEKSGKSYTPFDTDKIDRNNGVWNNVFSNLQDFGLGFAQGQNNQHTAPTPNPYGPILFVLKPEVLLEASNVAICLRSAGGHDFSREDESLSTIEDVIKIFTYPIIEDIPDNESLYAKSWIKRKEELQKEFGNKNAMSPEVSCVVPSERFSFENLSRIIVDPYVINNINLKDRVSEVKEEFGLHGVIWPRRYKPGRFDIKQELANLLIEGFVSPADLINNDSVSEELRDYASRIQKGNMTFFYNRFASYLRQGTLLELQNEVVD